MLTRSMWDATTRECLLARLARLTPADASRWGRMSTHEMVVHLGDCARMALGTMLGHPSRSRTSRWLRLPVVKHAFVYVLPFPRNASTAPELLSTRPGDWDEDVAAFVGMSEELAERAADPRCRWPEHPFFGRLSRRDWGTLGYRHTDHHLRQFGV